MVATREPSEVVDTPDGAPEAPKRLYWVDNLRTAIILLVVNMHACVTYSHIGDWYVTEGRQPSPLTKIAFGLWQGHLQAFFMGLLFFLSGVFAYGSVFRKGPGGFLRERLIRLGGPTLLYMLVIHPFIVLGLNPWHNVYDSRGAWYLRYLTSGEFIGRSGPLWFALALLLFCLPLALAVKMGWFTEKPLHKRRKAPGAKKLWAVGIAAALLTFLVRVWQPIGTSVLNFQLCFFPQYVLAFIGGIAIARKGTLKALALSSVARKAGRLALLLGPCVLFGVFLLSDMNEKPMMGGWNLSALGMAFWEQLAGLGLGLGMMALFARRVDKWGLRERWLSDRAFAVYVLHAPVLVALAMLFQPIHATAFAMVPLLTLTGLVVSYTIADLARRLPLLRSIL